MGVTEVFGHRGASGYLPENTLEALQLAFELGADAVEFDLVPSMDNQLVIRHEPELSSTTNIRALAQFESKKTVELIEGEKIQGWFSHLLSHREFLELRAIERDPKRVESATRDGKYMIPTLGDLLATPEFFSKKLIIELKHPDFYLERGFDLPKLLAAELEIAELDPEANHTLVIESFDWRGLVRAKELVGDKASYVFLAEPKTTPDDIDLLIDAVADNFDGLSLALPQFLERFDEQAIEMNSVLASIKEKGLLAYAYTARVEQVINLNRDFKLLAEAGFDGVFTDQPDVFRQFVAGEF
jgi:glycerophosphoryl diester phosphodiesterase